MSFPWTNSKPAQPLAPNQVHVWAWQLAGGSLDTANDLALLDSEELARYHRFHFDRDRARFAVAHGNLRRILGAYLGRAPHSIAFRSNRFGKPELAEESGSGPLHFNLTHSTDTALLALSTDTEVGIDVEEIRPIEPEVAEAHFSTAELADLNTLKAEDWLRGFYRCWTRKEAILKAEGVGLNLALNGFDVSLLPDAPAMLLQSRLAADRLRPWTLHDVSPDGTAAVAALAVGNAAASIACFRLAI